MISTTLSCCQDYCCIFCFFFRLLETVAYLEGGYLSSRLLDPVSLSVKRLKTLLDQRGVSYAGVVEKKELTDLVDGSGMFDTCNFRSETKFRTR